MLFELELELTKAGSCNQQSSELYSLLRVGNQKSRRAGIYFKIPDLAFGVEGISYQSF